MRRALSVLLALLSALSVAVPAQAATPEIWFPVQVTEGVSWVDSFGDSRGGGRTHKGVDIMAPQMQPVYAAQSGWIRRAYGGDSRECLGGARCTSYGMLIFGDDGRSYFYLHLNDDRPGRPGGCDHLGGAEHAFSPRLVQTIRDRGTLEPNGGDVVRVTRGELIGYVGSSGNAGCRVDHLHFETWAGHDFKGANDSGKDNPYPIVQAAYEANRFWDALGPIVPAKTSRLAGSDRVATAVAISREGFSAAKVAVIAPAEVYPEALVGGPLAAALGGPVLLQWGKQRSDKPFGVHPALVEELTRLGVEDVVVLSGGTAMDPRFEDALAAATSIDRDRIERFAAADRYELSARVARELLVHHGWVLDDEVEPEPTLLERILGGGEPAEDAPKPATISPILALGEHENPSRGWPDALAAGTLAAAQQVPIILTRPSGLPQPTLDVLAEEGFGEVRIVGGSGAISDAVEQQVADQGHATRRLAGPTRYHTALAIAGELIQLGHKIDDVFVATGLTFPDAMAAGTAVAARGRILLLIDGQVPTGAPSVLEWLRAQNGAVTSITAIGGPKAIHEDVLRVTAIHANRPTGG